MASHIFLGHDKFPFFLNSNKFILSFKEEEHKILLMIINIQRIVCATYTLYKQIVIF